MEIKNKDLKEKKVKNKKEKLQKDKNLKEDKKEDEKEEKLSNKNKIIDIDEERENGNHFELKNNISKESGTKADFFF